ncbi:unannotated protein [freshwater metagenome]|uniref:Unannotated protein n=1 Tax=freshwater metagenome TaxID=449393 RepID=A0A6J7KMY9_9ZZZZ
MAVPGEFDQMMRELVFRCSNVSVHASFQSLIAGSVRFLLYAVGYAQMIEFPGGTRWGWIVQLAGCALLAVGAIWHIDRLTGRIARPAVVFGILGAVIWAASSLPYAIDLQNWSSLPWARAFWEIWGAGAVRAAISTLLVIGKKRSLGRES